MLARTVAFPYFFSIFTVTILGSSVLRGLAAAPGGLRIGRGRPEDASDPDGLEDLLPQPETEDQFSIFGAPGLDPEVRRKVVEAREDEEPGEGAPLAGRAGAERHVRFGLRSRSLHR